MVSPHDHSSAITLALAADDDETLLDTAIVSDNLLDDLLADLGAAPLAR